MRTRTFRLTAVNGELVADTQATPGSEGVAHPVGVIVRSATVTRAWNVVKLGLPVFFSDRL